MAAVLLGGATVQVSAQRQASAQATPAKASVEVGAMYSVQPAETPGMDPSYPRPGVGGSSFGIVAGAAVALSPKVDLGVELSDPARFQTIQTTSGFDVSQIDNQHRDLIISGLLYLHRQRRNPHRPRFDVVGGFSIVREDTLQQTTYGPIGSNGPYNNPQPQIEITRTTYGVAGVADGDVPVSARVSLVPQARFYWISREGRRSQGLSAGLDLSPFVFRAALVLRVRF